MDTLTIRQSYQSPNGTPMNRGHSGDTNGEISRAQPIHGVSAHSRGPTDQRSAVTGHGAGLHGSSPACCRSHARCAVGWPTLPNASQSALRTMTVTIALSASARARRIAVNYRKGKHVGSAYTRTAASPHGSNSRRPIAAPSPVASARSLDCPRYRLVLRLVRR
jgi:hypothetical protein